MADPELQESISTEQALTVLQEVLEDEDLTLDDLQAYRKDRSGWINKYNSRNERLADKEKQLDERLEKAQKAASRPVPQAPQGNNQQPSSAEIEKAFYQRLGIDINDADGLVEVKPNQLYEVWNDLASRITGSRQQLVQLLGEYGLLEMDNDGVLRPPINVRKEIQEVREIAVTTQTQLYDSITDSFLAEVQEKYPDSDRKDLIKKIQSSDSEDLEADVWEAAKQQQKAFDDRVRSARDRDSSRRRTGMTKATMAGRGKAVQGKRPPNPLTSREGRRLLYERARQRGEQDGAV